MAHLFLVTLPILLLIASFTTSTSLRIKIFVGLATLAPLALGYSSSISRQAATTRRSTSSSHKMSSKKHPWDSNYDLIGGTEAFELLDDYKPGGFPVIQIGDLLHDNRYEIIDKLGHGGSPTVWMASCVQTNELVAIKALKATDSSAAEEVKILSRFTGKSDIRQLIESSKEFGPNGERTFLVLEPALCSVRDAKDHTLLPLPFARRLIADLVVIVQDLYAQGIVHGGMFMRKKQSVLDFCG